MTKSRIADGALGVLTVMLLCGVAVAPLLRGASPCTHDGGLYYHYVAALRHAFEQGMLFSRWLPDVAFGYGYPLFNYRAPISHYLTLGLHLLGLSLPWALNTVHLLSILGSAVGMYLLARDLFGVEAGFVAATAYAYAPYQFLDGLLRGNLPESVALALMPFILWAFRRLAREGGRRWFLAAVALLAALYLSHNISSLLFTPLLLAYLVALAWAYPGCERRSRVILALGLALGLTAFFWLPALGEKGYVQLNMARTTRNNDFRYNFLGFREIFALPDAVDTSLMNPPMQIHLGVAQALLGMLGLAIGLIQTLGEAGGSVETTSGCESAALRRQKRERSLSLILFAAFALIYLFLATQSSQWLWEHVPLLSFVQFPWRFVGRAALPVAVLAGAMVHYGIPTRRAPGGKPVARYLVRLSPPVLVAVLVLSALPSAYPPHGYCPNPPDASVDDVFAYERETGLVGVDPEGSYFPVWVEERPEQSPLETQYGSGSVERFDDTTLPEGAEILEAVYGPNRARLVVESPEAFRARYLSFYFPGWRVEVDGERVPVSPSNPRGLMIFDIPPGRHVVRVRFGETPLRLAADLLSGLCLGATLLCALRWPKVGGPFR